MVHKSINFDNSDSPGCGLGFALLRQGVAAFLFATGRRDTEAVIFLSVSGFREGQYIEVDITDVPASLR